MCGKAKRIYLPKFSNCFQFIISGKYICFAFLHMFSPERNTFSQFIPAAHAMTLSIENEETFLNESKYKSKYIVPDLFFQRHFTLSL